MTNLEQAIINLSKAIKNVSQASIIHTEAIEEMFKELDEISDAIQVLMQKIEKLEKKE